MFTHQFDIMRVFLFLSDFVNFSVSPRMINVSNVPTHLERKVSTIYQGVCKVMSESMWCNDQTMSENNFCDRAVMTQLLSTP